MRPVSSSTYNNIYRNSYDIEKLKSEISSSTLNGTSTSTTSSTSSASVLSSSLGGVEADVKKLLSEIPTGDDGTLSFREVKEYKEKLEDAWDAEVKEDLKKLGVDTDKALGLSYDSTTGKVVAGAGHPQKDIIDKYFESNQDKIDEFDKIIRLGKLTKASETKLTESQLRKSLQQQAMVWWSDANVDSQDYFSGGGTLLGLAGRYKSLSLKI